MPILDFLFPARPPELRDARIDDAAAIAVIHAAAFHRGWGETEFERLLGDSAVRAVVARSRGLRAGPVIGFVLSRRAGDEAEVLSIAVDPASRGRGLATQLLARHLGRLAAEGVAALFLEVEETNGPALALYRRAGFREVGRRQAYYGRPGAAEAIDALVMRRDLV